MLHSTEPGYTFGVEEVHAILDFANKNCYSPKSKQSTIATGFRLLVESDKKESKRLQLQYENEIKCLNGNENE